MFLIVCLIIKSLRLLNLNLIALHSDLWSDLNLISFGASRLEIILIKEVTQKMLVVLSGENLIQCPYGFLKRKLLLKFKPCPKAKLKTRSP